MNAVFSSLLSTLFSCFRTRASMQIEILALRHQLAVLQRSAKKRPSLGAADRVLWVWLSRVLAQWRSALALVKPETVIAWHRKGFRLYWTWKSRAGKTGRPSVSREVRELIREMSRANPLWGAPRIHGELLKLGVEISQATVAKYMARKRKPPSQTWRTFLENHVKELVSIVSLLCQRSVFESCLCSWFWPTIAVALFTSTSLPIPPPNGPLSRLPKHSLGTVRRGICCAIEMRFMENRFGNEFWSWAFTRYSPRHDCLGRILM